LDACGLEFGDWLVGFGSALIEFVDFIELASLTITSVVFTISESTNIN